MTVKSVAKSDQDNAVSTSDQASSACSVVEAKFAQRLAANEKKTRDRAFKKLRQFMVARSMKPDGGFIRDELIRIWKGMFYCMWMSDKPLVQEELANQMAELLTQLRNTKTSMLYFETFVATMQREWLGIDRLRMDKFLLLTRFMLQQGFQCLKNNGWNDGDIDWFMSILSNGPLTCVAPTASKTSGPALGIRYHFTDIYLEELTTIAEDSIASNKVTKLLKPFISLINNTSVIELRSRVAKKIFQEIIDQSDAALKLVSEVSGEAPPEIKRLNYDYTEVANALMEGSSQPDAMGRNRKRVYKLVQNLREVASGNLPLDDFPNIPPDEEELPDWKMEDKMAKDLAYKMTKELDEEYKERKREKRESRKLKRKATEVEDGLCEADLLTTTIEVKKTESTENATKKTSKNKYAKVKNKNKKKQKSEEKLADKTAEKVSTIKAEENSRIANDQDTSSEGILVGSAFSGLSSSLEQSCTETDMDCTLTELLQNRKQDENPGVEFVELVDAKEMPKKRKVKTPKNAQKRQRKLDLLKESVKVNKLEENVKEIVEPVQIQAETVDETNSGDAFIENTKSTVKKKPKVKKFAKKKNAKNNLVPEAQPIQENVVDSTVSADKTEPDSEITAKFATFTSTVEPTAAFFKSAVSKAKAKTPRPKKRAASNNDVHASKRVSFEMSKIQIQPFRKNEKSSAVSCSPHSVPFDPQKTPDFGLLKPKRPVTRRSKASEFF